MHVEKVSMMQFEVHYLVVSSTLEVKQFVLLAAHEAYELMLKVKLTFFLLLITFVKNVLNEQREGSRTLAN